MKATENYNLNLLEPSDLMSVAPLNDNARKIDAAMASGFSAQTEALKAGLSSQTDALNKQKTELSKKIGVRVLMATGSYVGNGAEAVEITTPGFKAEALLVFCSRDEYSSVSRDKKVSASKADIEAGDYPCSGFSMWNGEDINSAYWYEDGTIKEYDELSGGYKDVTAYTKTAATVKFTPSLDKLKWELTGGLSSHVKYRPERSVNNVEGVTYKWVAWGTEVI